MSITLIVLAFVEFFLMACGVTFGGRLPKQYRNRACQGSGWREAFPSATKNEIRSFLSLFVGAFAFDKAERLKLAPSDKILDIYRAQYPSRLTPDAMEIETLAFDLERAHGFKLEDLWNDSLTLGQLFSQTQGNAADAP